jgi:uncharacterized membrane protein/heat shock protein HslJ
MTRMKHLLALLPAVALSACMAPPPPPPMTPNPPGDEYRALGTEPFWNLTIDPQQMVFTRPDAPPLAQPTPRVIVGFAGEIYRTPRLNVNIVHAQCNDGMSDRTYRDKVQVEVDGQHFDGCGGGAMAPATGLAGTTWHIASVNSRVTPAQGDYSMRFDEGRLAAKFGCNNMGGAYTQDADILHLGPVMATRMACPDMSFEDQGSAILAQPLTLTWSGGDHLTLSNGVGRIELARVY